MKVRLTVSRLFYPVPFLDKSSGIVPLPFNRKGE